MSKEIAQRLDLLPEDNEIDDMAQAYDMITKHSSPLEFEVFNSFVRMLRNPDYADNTPAEIAGMAMSDWDL